MIPPPTFVPHPHAHANLHHLHPHHHAHHSIHAMHPPYLFSSPHHATPNLPPLPSHPAYHLTSTHAHAHPHIPPPFGAPPMFVHHPGVPPPAPPYLMVSNRPPPLMRGNSSTNTMELCTKTDNSANLDTSNDENNDNENHHQHNHNNGEQQATDGDGGGDTGHAQNHKNGNCKSNKNSPLMFPFAQQSPQIFASVGPMHSPSLFGVNNVPQTPQMFAQTPMFLPAPNPNVAMNSNHHHSTMMTHAHNLDKTKLSQFAATSATLPMPLTVMTSSNSNSNSNSSPMDSTSPILNGNTQGTELDIDDHHHQHHQLPAPQSPLHAPLKLNASAADDNCNHRSGHNSHKNVRPFATSSCSRASSVCNTAAATAGSPTVNGSIKHRTASSNSSLNACTTPTPPNSNTARSTLTTSSDKNAGNLSSRSSNEHDNNNHSHHNGHNHQHTQIAVSVDSVRTSQSHSASLSAVATAGGLTVNTPLPSISSVMAAGTMSINTDVKSTISDAPTHHPPPPASSSLLPALPAHIVLPQLQPSPKTVHASTVVTLQHSCNSIETQIGSTPPCHPNVNVVTSSPSSASNQSTHEHMDADKTNIPLHQRRSMGNAPSMLNIP